MNIDTGYTNSDDTNSATNTVHTNTDTNTDTVILIVFSQMLQRLKSQASPSMSPWMLYPAAGLSGEHKIKTSSIMPISSELDKGTSLVLP